MWPNPQETFTEKMKNFIFCAETDHCGARKFISPVSWKTYFNAANILMTDYPF